jgi:hypothetical protein
MVKSCALCQAKAKFRCDHCNNDFCPDHAVKCTSCGTITCIRDLSHKVVCPICGNSTDICPECLINEKVVRLIPGANICGECGWGAKERKV